MYPKKHLSSVSAVPDIGTAYINGTLRANGHDSFIIDAPGEGIGEKHPIEGTNLEIGGIDVEQILKRIPNDVEMIGIQSMHSNRWIYDSVIVEQVLKNFPEIKIVLGGEHVSACADYILKRHPGIYACVIGEGEETILEVIESIEGKKDLKDIKGIAFNQNNIIRFTERRVRKKNVDEIPLPSWKGVPIENYLKNNCGVNSFSRRSITMVATRGCPHTCTFCTVPNMWDSKWYARDPRSVVDEIKSYIKDYGVNHIDFVDLTIVIQRQWMERFCRILIRENLDLTWAIPIGTRTEGLDRDLLKLMKEAGLQRVLYSAESGDDETLERIKKKLVVNNFSQIVKDTSDLGICVKVALIFGFPGQTYKEVFGTFKLINKLAWLGASDIVCLSFIPYPKTELFDELKVTYDYEKPDMNIRLNNDIPNMKSWSEHFGDRTLRFFIWFFTLYFYFLQGLFRPRRVIAGFYRVFVRSEPLTNFESIIHNSILKK